MAKAFLTASWVNLLMANFAVDKKILEPYKPAFTEIDDWNGTCYVSLVGFLFKDTRVMGIRFPFHTTFEEVNLRFYVRRKESGEWRRGVVFIKELVPKSVITFIANTVYSENYETRKMWHSYTSGEFLDVEYGWNVGRDRNYLKATASIHKQKIIPGSEPEFITEHYWGYSKQNAHKTSTYEVQHPVWSIHPITSFDYHCSVKELYGESFVEPLKAKPTSVFLADGSEISVMTKNTLSA